MQAFELPVITITFLYLCSNMKDRLWKVTFHRRFFLDAAAEREAREKRLFSHLRNPTPLRASDQ